MMAKAEFSAAIFCITWLFRNLIIYWFAVQETVLSWNSNRALIGSSNVAALANQKYFLVHVTIYPYH